MTDVKDSRRVTSLTTVTVVAAPNRLNLWARRKFRNFLDRNARSPATFRDATRTVWPIPFRAHAKFPSERDTVRREREKEICRRGEGRKEGRKDRAEKG